MLIVTLVKKFWKTISGNGNLVQLHETLKDLQSKILNQEKHYEVLQIELDKEIQKNERIKDQVKSFKERQSLHDKVRLYWIN